MAEASSQQPVTKQELDIYGVSITMVVTMVARVGNKTFSSSVSPVDYEVFKSNFYRDKLYEDLIKRVEHDIAE